MTNTTKHGTVERITLGTRRGVEWTCWREPGESDAEFEARYRAMAEAFASGVEK